MNIARNFLAGVSLLALAACTEAPDAPAPAETQPDAQPDARSAELARAIAAAEAVRSVKRLQWAYGHYSEFGLWHDFADLFADTGVGHYVQGDLDREGIRALFLEQVGQGRLGLADGRIYPHISFAPVVTLAEDGEHARARFRILGMLGGYGGNATWFHGVYENAYVKERGTWKLAELANAAQITGDFTAGLAAATAPAFALHFTPEQVGRIPVIARAAADDPASLQRRAQRLADEAAITDLQHRYGYYLDTHDWDALVELFAEQGTFETDQRGVYVGKAGIRNALNQFGALRGGDVDEHILFQTYVSIAPDGQRGAARVDQLGIQSRQGGSAEWTQGIYENTFVKEGGQWRIQSLHYYPRLITDFTSGWAADAQPAPGPSASHPPAAPPTETYEIYPSFYLPAFHFSHPVTGRAPQYPDGSTARNRAPELAAAPQAQDAEDSGAGQLPLEAVEAMTQQALARDAVENLIDAYVYYADACMAREAAALFADGALQSSLCPAGEQEADARSLHHATQPVIALAADGLSATVQSKLWRVSADAGGSYQGGLLHGEAIREGGQWKLTAVATEYRWSARGLGARPLGR